MNAYASRTGTRRNLAALRAAGWRLLVSATGPWRTEGFRYGIDNGAWTAFKKGRPFDADLFRGLVDALGAGADFIVVPDIVMGGLASLEFSLTWLGRLRGVAPLLLPVQDGMVEADVASLVGSDLGVFVGGGDEFKETTMASWGRLARAKGAYLHVGRVNTARRIKLCAMAGADSFDGTSASRYAKTCQMLDNNRRQTAWKL